MLLTQPASSQTRDVLVQLLPSTSYKYKYKYKYFIQAEDALEFTNAFISLLDGIQIQNGIRHIEFEWPAFELNLNDAGFQVESIQETRIKILNIVLFIRFWIGVL